MRISFSIKRGVRQTASVKTYGRPNVRTTGRTDKFDSTATYLLCLITGQEGESTVLNWGLLRQYFRIDFRLMFGLTFEKSWSVSRRCRRKNPPSNGEWSIEPPRPRRNPNRKGYQADAAGEKRTDGRTWGEPKTPRKNPRRRLNVYLVSLDS